MWVIKGPNARLGLTEKSVNPHSRYVEAMAERLQKIMARAGIASRRKAEELIARGRVRVNGVILKRSVQPIL
jgi:ribosomal protein S4